MESNMKNNNFEIDNLIKKIFNDEPKLAHSINVIFDYSGDDNESIEFLFKQLASVFTEGMKIKYGDSNGIVDLEQLDDNDFL